MATESGAARPTLARRATSTVRRVFDDEATGAQKARAGLAVAAATAGVTGAGLSVGAIADHLATTNPAVLHALTGPVGSSGEIGLAVGAGAAAVVYGVGFFSSQDGTRTDYLTERSVGDSWVGRVRTGVAVVGGAAAMLGTGIAAGDIAGLHAAALDTGLWDVAAATGGVAATMSLGRLITRIGSRRAVKTVS